MILNDLELTLVIALEIIIVANTGDVYLMLIRLKA